MVAALQGVERGSLKLAILTTVKYTVPKLLGGFCAAHPGIEVAMLVGNRENLLQRLAANQDDLYIMGQPPEQMDVVSEAFADNPLVLVAPPDHPLVGQKAISPQRLAKEPFILREAGSGTRLTTEKFFAGHGIALKNRLEVGSNEAIKQTVAGGLGLAVLSATTTSTNQNIWIEEMKKQIGDFPGLNLVTTVYGDDLADKSYREANGLLTSQTNVKVIVAPTTVGVLAASQAVKDAGKIGDVYVTGLGLPSEMAGAIQSGATKEFAIWNPIDLGYSATQIAYRLAKGETDAAPGSEIEAGRMGKIKVGDGGEAAMADPFVYDASNIEEFSKIF